MTHTETQAMCERLMHDLTHILPPTQDTWRGLLTDAADLLTRQQEEIERLREALEATNGNATP